MNKKTPDNQLCSNRKAFHNYDILESYEAGISLLGTEVKSIKNHSASLVDAYVIEKDDELWLINAYIPPYSHSTAYVPAERRDRKLLMHKTEISKLSRQLAEKSLTIIPLSLYLKKGKIKVKIALARGKKKYDKREKLKSQEHKKTIKQAMKDF